MDLDWLLNFLAWVALFGAGIVPLVISIRVKNTSLRILSLFLGLFAITHGLYHLSDAYGMSFVADAILEPISVVFLVGFGLYYSKKAGL